MAKPGLPKKYAKMGFKKGWREFKKAMAKRAGKLKRRVSKGVKRKTKNNPTKKGVRKMATKKRRGGSTTRRRPRRRVGLLPQTTVNALITGLMIAAPAIGGVWAINQIPWVKDQKPWAKALVQAAMGALGLTFLRGSLAKKISSGVIAGGGMQLILPYVPGVKFGAGRRFTPSELAALQTMGKPRQIPGDNNVMGKPVYAPGMAGRSRNSNR